MVVLRKSHQSHLPVVKRNVWFQGILMVGLFLLILFGLRQVNWIELLNVRQAGEATEEKLGKMLWDVFRKSDGEIKDPYVINALDSILTRICEANDIDQSHIKLHLLDKDEVNAFALPDGHLVLFSGLINDCENESELIGVMCHELAHIELRHVMKKLVREIGFSAIISITTGAGGGDVMQVAKMLSSSAYDRSLEKEADIKAVDYMVKARVNPLPLGNFLYRLSANEVDDIEFLSWFSTHPETIQRAEYVVAYSNEKVLRNEKILAESTWEEIGKRLSQGVDLN